MAASLACTSSENRPNNTGGTTGQNGGTTGSNGGTTGQNGGTTGSTGGTTGDTGGTTGSTGGTTGSTGGTTGQTGGTTGSTGGTTGAGGSGGKGGTTGGGGGVAAGGSLGTGGAVVVNPGTCGKLQPVPTSQSVLTRGNNPQRTAHFIQPSLTTASVKAKFGADTTFNAAAKFTGGLEGVPLFVAGATAGTGTFIVAGNSGTVTAIDETAGTTKWSRNLGGNIKSTPVIDPATSTLYVAQRTSTGGDHYELHAMNLASMGAELTGWPVNLSTIKSNNNDTVGGFDPGKEIQRGALSFVNGVVYVPFGGVYGDGPPYKGFVAAVSASNPSTTGGWSASGDRSGLWQSGGLASDGTSMFASTANGGDGTHMDSEEVIRISGMGTSSHANKDVFFPSNWKTWDGQDNDLGSSSPMVLQFSGGTCQSLVVAPSKPGHLFFLDPANLGGNTPLRDLAVGNASAGGEYKVFYAAPTGYISTSGVHVALEARLDAQCPGGGGGDSLVGIKVDMTTTPPTPTVQWCAAVAGGEDRHHPISTTTDGVQNAIVWFVVGGGLKGFDGETGASVFSGPGCGNIQKQTAPIAADGHVIVGADGKLCSYSVQP
ncbi:MAG TPA: hypothetical protein VHJ20_17270 [Polyangia bacterium]|nr:hypothetical protein [Polyangia bacterium]